MSNFFRFEGGELRASEVPNWYARIDAEGEKTGGDWLAIMSRHGVHAHSQFGEHLDSVYIFDAGEHGYFVEYWDVSQCIATIFITDVVSYLEFRSKHLYPWAWLIAEGDRIADEKIRQTVKDRRKPA